MRKPYDLILVVAIVATIIFFVLFDKPINPDKTEDMHDIGVLGWCISGLFSGSSLLRDCISASAGNTFS